MPPITFLGAGASAPFGYPPTGPFVDKLMERIPNSVREGVLVRSVHGVEGVEDVEQILEILDTIAELHYSPARKFFDNASLTIPGMGGVSYRELEALSLSLRARIRTEIFREYSWKQKSGERFDLYRSLFSIYPMPDTPILEVFTTNYDRVVEEYCAHEEIPLVDGFELDSRRRLWEWDPSIMGALSPVGGEKSDGILGPTLLLYKLHGSLNWRKTIEGRIEQVRPEEPIGIGGEDAYTENVLVYPGGKNQPTSEPFRWLYESFTRRIRNAHACVVVGFSFRDEYLNTVFSEFLEKDNSSLIVISPSASDNVKRNLLGNRPIDKLQKKGRLLTIDKVFEITTVKELSDVLIEKGIFR